MKKCFESILLWGSLWGICEATLGHLLHLLPFNIGWIFWFPIAYFFMHKVYEATGKASSVLAMSFLVAAFKLLDLIAPVRIDFVINPAAAIVIEGLCVFALFKLNEKKIINEFLLYNCLVVSVCSQLLYIAYVLIVSSFFSVIPGISGINQLFTYLFHSFINGFTIYLFLKYFRLELLKFAPYLMVAICVVTGLLL